MKKLFRALSAVALMACAPAFAQAPATAPAKPAVSAPAKPAAKATLLDINSASQADLQALKGIGDVRAKGIIAGRPYKGKDDLVQKKIIPQAVYDGIKDQIIAKQK
jgi:DNA uptake protein ComE-like DNA-binding protein